MPFRVRRAACPPGRARIFVAAFCFSLTLLLSAPNARPQGAPDADPPAVPPIPAEPFPELDDSVHEDPTDAALPAGEFEPLDTPRARLARARRLLTQNKAPAARALVDALAEEDVPEAAAARQFQLLLDRVLTEHDRLMKAFAEADQNIPEGYVGEDFRQVLRRNFAYVTPAAIQDRLQGIEEFFRGKPKDAVRESQRLRLWLRYPWPCTPSEIDRKLETLLAAELALDGFFGSNVVGAEQQALQDLRLIDLPRPWWEALVRGYTWASPTQPPPRRGEAGYTVRTTGAKAKFHYALPDTYDPRRKWPTVLLLHGTHGDGGQILNWMWPRLQEAGVVCIAPTGITNAGKGWGGTEAEYAEALDALDEAVQRFNIDPDRVFVSGYSRGGHAAFGLAINHGDRFAGAIPMAGTVLGPSYASLESLKNVPVFLVYGGKDVEGQHGGIAGNNQIVVRDLRKLKCDLTVKEYSAEGHSLPLDSEVFEQIFEWMDRRVRNPMPRSVVSITKGQKLRRFYWGEDIQIVLEAFKTIANVTIEQDPHPMVRASWSREGNRLDITERHIRLMSVMLSEKMVDFNRPVDVMLDSKRAYHAKRIPKLETLLREVKRTHDTSRLYWDQMLIQQQGGMTRVD